MTELTGAGTWQHSNVWAGGKLVATYDTKGIHYEIADPLGTKRVQANAAGQVDEQCTGLPFGNDVNNPLITNCTASTNSLQTNDDATEHHFTQKERDVESGNDYFLARYYTSAMGRFLSPDWSAKVVPVPYAKMGDPQTLNLYAYVLNNPITHVDADGHACRAGDWGCNAWNAAAQTWNQIHQIAIQAKSQTSTALTQARQSVKNFEKQHPRTMLAASGVKNLVIAAGKSAATGALIATAPESGGLTLAAAAYTGSSAAGNGVAGFTQLTAAAFGSNEDLEKADNAAETVTTLTTVSGLGTAIATGGDMKAASHAAAYEGFATSLMMPEGGAPSSAFGRMVQGVGGTTDKMDTAASTANAICDSAGCNR